MDLPGTLLAWLQRVARMVDHLNGDLFVRLGDSAGANKLSIHDADDVEVGHIDSTGNATISGDISISGTLKSQTTAESAVFALDAADGPGITIANDNTIDLTGGSDFSGLFLVTDIVSGGTGAFLQGGGSMVLLGASLAIFSTTPGTASKINIYQDGSYHNIVENKRGSSVTIRVMMLRTRSNS